jgi:23S rRNA (uracil1939-C5)-methyltransferase
MARQQPRSPADNNVGKVKLYPIESIDLEANGISRTDGKVCFVRGALPGELVLAEVVRSKAKYDVAQTLKVLKESSQRVTPACPHFGICGGCSMQHLTLQAQLAIKQRGLEDQLWHLGRVKAETLLRPISGPAWGYRYRARLSVRLVTKKGQVLVGFHERASGFVADMQECKILQPRVDALLMPLRTLIASMSISSCLPQIEVAVGERLARSPLTEAVRNSPNQQLQASVDSSSGAKELVVALVFRILERPSDSDEDKLLAFAKIHKIELWYQPKGPDTIFLFCTENGRVEDTEEVSQLGYFLPEYGIHMPYKPTDFTQVNHSINTVLVGQAVRLLDPQADERIADLFCGLGNFTLPLATRAASVLGIEGAASLTQRAKDAATHNGLSHKTNFKTRNLFELTFKDWRALGPFDRVLIDPPREGALAVVQALAEDRRKPKRIVYVSCNPSTLARDASVLCNGGGWTLKATGAVNMFPHTSHVESISVFEPSINR